ncbi:MAG: hypothetical protein OZ917_03365, partial [Candidatus Brocadiaceae bacterium]|nr:hypothetical protein [Candidatus Brocadiaceae bacterium]
MKNRRTGVTTVTFAYDVVGDSYVYPEESDWRTGGSEPIRQRAVSRIIGWFTRGRECEACQKRSLCTKAKARELLIDIREPLLQKMREKLISDEGRRKYF